MWISEIFYSIQGEGSLIGIPSVFVRTSGCNLRCDWCDTKYASWNPEGEHLSVTNVMKQIMHFSCHHVVITGGEPMIDKDIVILTNELHKENKHITIETAATLFHDEIKCDLASLSPKLSNSTPKNISPSWIKKHEERRISVDAMKKWINHSNYQFKFVISDEKDISELLEIIKLIPEVPKYKIFLMPQGIDTASLKKRSLWLVEECKKYGFSYTPRIHVDLFGNKRGV